MTGRSFEASSTVRNTTAVVAYANGLALLASLVVAAFGRPEGLVLAPLWLWGTIEAGRAAWSNYASVTLTSEVVRVERSDTTDIVDLADVSWFGLTRRGVVIEWAAGRSTVFDQDWASATVLARELDAVVGYHRAADGVEAPALTVSHDKVRQLTNLGLLGLIATGTALISIAAVVGDLNVFERAVSLGTAAPICLWTAVQTARLGRRPVSATFLFASDQGDEDREAVSFKRLYGAPITVETPSVQTALSTTLTQRLTGAAPGEAIFVRSSILNWTGPIAAPRSFDRVADLYGRE